MDPNGACGKCIFMEPDRDPPQIHAILVYAYTMFHTQSSPADGQVHYIHRYNEIPTRARP